MHDPRQHAWGFLSSRHRHPGNSFWRDAVGDGSALSGKRGGHLSGTENLVPRARRAGQQLCQRLERPRRQEGRLRCPLHDQPPGIHHQLLCQRPPGRRGHADESRLQERRDPAPTQRRRSQRAGRAGVALPAGQIGALESAKPQGSHHRRTQRRAEHAPLPRPHSALVRKAPAASGAELDRGPGGPALFQRHNRPAQGRHAEPAESGGQQHPVHLQRAHVGTRHPAHLPALLPHLRHDAGRRGHLRRRYPGHHGGLRPGAFAGPGAAAQGHPLLRRAAHHGRPGQLPEHQPVRPLAHALYHGRRRASGARGGPARAGKNRRVRPAGIRPYGSLTGDAPEPRRSGLREARFGRPGGAEPGTEDRRSHHRRAGVEHRQRRRAAHQGSPRHEGVLEVPRRDEPRAARRLAGDRRRGAHRRPGIRLHR